jgi:hypothetical protein
MQMENWKLSISQNYAKMELKSDNESAKSLMLEHFMQNTEILFKIAGLTRVQHHNNNIHRE